MDTQTRHALKQDKFVQATQSGMDWLEDHRANVIRASVAGVILLAIVIAGIVIYNQRSAAARTAFGKAMDVYNAPLAQPGEPANASQDIFASAQDRSKAAYDQFSTIASRYGHMEAGENARYFAGLTAMDLGKNAEAEADLKKASSYGSGVGSLAKFALASLYASTGRQDQAVSLYQGLIAKPTATVPASAAQLQLAALYQTTNPAEAAKIYAQLKNDKTAAGQIAAQKLGQK